MSESDTLEDTTKLFKKVADTYIDVANQHLDKHGSDLVGSAFVYGAARFSAFMVASGSRDVEVYRSNRENAIEHFTAQFKRMLEENLSNYESAFKEEKKYKQYMKK